MKSDDFMSTASQELKITTPISPPSPTKGDPSPVLSALADALAGALGSVSFTTYVVIYFNKHWSVKSQGSVCDLSRPLSETMLLFLLGAGRQYYIGILTVTTPTAMVNVHFKSF